MRHPNRALRPSIELLDERCLLSGLTPAQVGRAYGMDGLTFTTPGGETVKADGSGQTIALIEAYHAPTLVNDLHVFNKTYGLPDVTPTVVNLAGASTDAGWSLETAMDVQWAHALAPGANLLVVEAASPALNDLIKAIQVARNTPGVVAISMSWGMSEFPTERQYDSVFTTPAGHTGITYFAASGDNGPAAGSQWPASSPNVVAVGGTTLNVGSGGQYQSETAWAYSGGGYSRYEAEPNYQRGIQATGKRSTPDVSFNADTYTGVMVYHSFATSRHGGGWQTVGGTSLGAPAWAAIIAIVDQGRSLTGKGSLDGATQTLPALYAQPSSAYYSVSSTSSFVGSLLGTSTARLPASPNVEWAVPFRSRIKVVKKTSRNPARANTLTGLGSPRGASLVPGLVNYTPRASTAATRKAMKAIKSPRRVVAHVRAQPLARPAWSQVRTVPGVLALSS